MDSIVTGIEQAKQPSQQTQFIRKDNRYEFNSLSISRAFDLAFF